MTRKSPTQRESRLLARVKSEITEEPRLTRSVREGCLPGDQFKAAPQSLHATKRGRIGHEDD